MTTIADLILKFVNTVFKSKDSILKQKREERDRIAEYFESLSDALNTAAKEFETGNDPWYHYHQLSYQLRDFRMIVEGVIEKEKKEELFRELLEALENDFGLLKGTRERVIVDAITLRPLYYDYSEDDKENPVGKLSQRQLEFVIQEEINKIYQVAGLFKGVAVELRAT